MRVLLTTSLYPTPAASFTLGGAEIFARRFCERLLADGHEVEVVRAMPRSYAGDEVVNGVAVRSVPRNNIFLPYGDPKPALLRGTWHVVDDHVRASSLLAERIAAFKPDVLHSNTLAGLGADIWRVAAEQGVPVVHTLHDYYLTCPRCSRYRERKICDVTCNSCTLLTMGRRRQARHVSAIVGVSQRIVDIHHNEGLFRDTPIQTVVRNAAYDVGPVTREAVSSPLVMGYMGRITQDKGLGNLIPALAAAPRAQVRLVVAGRIDEAAEATLRALAPQSDIQFLGFVRPEEFFRQVDVVAVPSLWEEPGSLVIEEALAAGRPVIVSPFGGSPEAIEHGVTGWVVRPEIAPLAQLIGEIVSEPNVVARMQHHLMYERRHRTMGDVAGGYVDIYERAVAAGDGVRYRRGRSGAPEGRPADEAR